MIIVGIILVLVALIAFVVAVIARRDCGEEGREFSAVSTGIAVVALVIGLLLGGLSFFTTIPTGHTGIVTLFGKVEDYTLQSGIHTVNPFARVIEMDNRVQKQTIELSCFSSDIQEVKCSYTLNYQISKENAQEIYKSIGKDYYDTAISPNIAESVKTIVAHYNAEELVANRDKLASEIEALLKQKLTDYYIEVVSTAVEDLDFTDAFTNAVESKQVAVQNKLKAQTEQEQKTMEAKQTAERAKIQAEADKEIARIKAEADAEASRINAEADLKVQQINADATEYVGQKESAKNKAISESLTDELLRYYFITQWNGEYPDYYVGSDNISTIVGLPTGQ